MQANEWLSYQYRRKYMQYVILPAFFQAGLKKEYHQMLHCGDFVHAIQCCACHARHFAGFWRCRSRFCANCSHIRSLSWIARLYPKIREWIENFGNCFFLNLTVRDDDSLRDSLFLLSESYRYMTNSERRYRKYWKSRFLGGVRSLEVKLGENSRKWHPHFHCIVLTDSTYQKDFDIVREMWENSVKVISGKKQKSASVWFHSIDTKNIIQSICESVKYISEFDEDSMSEIVNMKSVEGKSEYGNRLIELVYELKGKKSISTWGVLRGMEKEVEKDVECIEEEKLTNFVCQLCGCEKGKLMSFLYEEVKNSILLDV